VKAIMNPGRWPAVLVFAIVLAAAPECVRAFVNARNAPPASNPTLAPQQQQTYRPSNARPPAGLNVQTQPVQTPRPQGIPYDWSHRHLIFSRPSSPAMARRLEHEPRYQMQQAWRHRQAVAGSAEAYMQQLDALAVQLATARKLPTLPPLKGKPLPKKPLHGDWSVSLGSASAKVGAGRYPAKYSFDVNATPDCTNDFVVFNTGLSGGSQASIVAFNKLYSGCATTVPAVYWAYNTGGTITNSVVLSGDGSQVAFVQSTNSHASLVVLKWAPSTTETVISPMTLTSNSSYPSCTAPCMITLLFNGSGNDTNSSPFYDYTNDVIYVGDNNGALHQFTNVFKGTPAEVVVAGTWPVSINIGSPLTSPVLDSGVAPPIVYVADSADTSLFGTLAYVNSSTGAVKKSGLIGRYVNLDIADAPLVDSVAGKIYVAVSKDSNGNSAVFAFSRSFTSGTSGTEVAIGTAAGAIAIPIYAGSFDNAYYSSSNPATPTGNLYVCGNAGGSPTLYQVPINAGAFGAVHAGPNVAGANVTCSPVTEIYNPNATGGPFDWIFLSVQNNGSLTNCASGGCVMSFIVTAWQKANAYSLNQEILDSNLNIQKVTTAGTSGNSQPSWATSPGVTTSDGTGTLVWTNQGPIGSNTNAASRAESGGTSGIIVDNVSASSGASQVYFSTLSGGTAVQASQSGLSQ